MFQTFKVSGRRWSSQKEPWRWRHSMELQVPRALLAVSSAADELFSVVQHLGLTERRWKWQARFQQLGSGNRRSLRFSSPPVPHWIASVLVHSLRRERML